MDKCFCHLNGYAVKDATARQEINTIKTTYATKDELNSIEIPEVNLEPYATKEYVDGKIINYTTLFNSDEGTSATITLSDNVTNYDYLEVHFAHGTALHCSKVIAKEGHNICLDANHISPNDKISSTQQCQLSMSGNTLTWVHKTSVEHGTNYHTYYDNTASIKIYRVVGIK